MTSNWSEGDPQLLAQQFIQATASERSLSPKSMRDFVAAIACAAIYNIMQEQHPTQQCLHRVENVLKTAKTIIAAYKPRRRRRRDSSDDDQFTEDQALLASPDELAAAANEVQLPSNLQQLVGQLEQRYLQQQRPEEVVSSQLQLNRNHAVLPLSESLLEVIISRLDNRTAAKAATSCKQFAAAYRNLRWSELPSPAVETFQGLVCSALRCYNELSDGSEQTAFTLAWPLDGSAVAGYDVADDAQMRAAKMAASSFSSILIAFDPMGPERWKKYDCSRPAPQANSSPLALFVTSRPVPLYSSAAAAVAAAALQQGGVGMEHGMFNATRRVCADAGNGLVWCAGDGSKRIKAFRAPQELGGARNVDAACNRIDNKMTLQYTLNSQEKGGMTGTLAAVREFNLEEMEAYEEERDEAADDTDGSGLFKGDIGKREPEDCRDLECSRGVKPRFTARLQQPSPAAEVVPDDSSYRLNMRTFPRGIVPGHCMLVDTCCLADGGGSRCHTLAAVVSFRSDPVMEGSMVVTYDLETQQSKNLLLGHLDRSTCDVKIWDCRCRGGAAAVTLTYGLTHSLNAVVLAANNGSGGSAGGANEAVCVWDIRARHAQALYSLSSGNLEVKTLLWHKGSSSLIASCDNTRDY
eukprot:gene5493-5728_t